MKATINYQGLVITSTVTTDPGDRSPTGYPGIVEIELYELEMDDWPEFSEAWEDSTGEEAPASWEWGLSEADVAIIVAAWGEQELANEVLGG